MLRRAATPPARAPGPPRRSSDPREIARFERGEVRDGESINRPLRVEDVGEDEFLRL
jgi:hypothetical protein